MLVIPMVTIDWEMSVCVLTGKDDITGFSMATMVPQEGPIGFVTAIELGTNRTHQGWDHAVGQEGLESEAMENPLSKHCLDVFVTRCLRTTTSAWKG